MLLQLFRQNLMSAVVFAYDKRTCRIHINPVDDSGTDNSVNSGKLISAVTALAMTAAMFAAALALPRLSAGTIASGAAPVSPFAATLAVFWITAFASATHDIAADGFTCWP